jgi:hypothetical protein
VLGCGRWSSFAEVMSTNLAKLASLTVSWMDQTPRSELSTTCVWVLIALERGGGPGQDTSLRMTLGLQTNFLSM